MAKPELETIFTHGGEDDSNIRFQYDKNTNELYVNDKKVVTEIGFSKAQKVLGWLVSGAIIAQGVMSILTFIFK